MLTAPIPDDEEDRLAELHRLEILYTEPEAAFDRVTRELAEIFQVPISTLSLIDRDHQFYKAAHGIPPEVLGARTSARAHSVCGHVVGDNAMLVVNDLAADSRFADNPMIQAAGVRFYAGAPLRTNSGHAVGSLCIIDTKPRHITGRETKLLQMIADTVMAEVRLRQVSREIITISSHLADRNKIIERDLSHASAVQRFLLPPQTAQREQFLICHIYQPVQHIGGDYLDFMVRTDGSVVLLIADVSGHGATAAMTSAMTKTTFLHAAPNLGRPADLLTRIHTELCPIVPAGQFMTALAVIFNPQQRSVHLASAGHPYPVLLRERHAATVEIDNEVPLLIDRDHLYTNATTLDLNPGDRVIFYTDGAIEASNPAGHLLGTPRFTKLIASESHLSGQPFLQEVFAKISTFAHGHLNDDIAIVSFEAR